MNNINLIIGAVRATPIIFIYLFRYKFYFTIPYVKSKKKKSEPNPINLPDKASLPLNNLKVLIVEDDKISVNFISRIIDGTSNTLLFAQTGTVAVKLYQEYSDIDLILMDIKIPEMDGYDSTKEIRKFNREVIIIAQTAYALAGDREKALACGCTIISQNPS
ncbi:MAG: response regulator [Bacteroidales bacterium]|nr:response regulator [Bacteroidales bacterium]